MPRPTAQLPAAPGPHRFFDLAQDPRADRPLDVQVIRTREGLAVQFEPTGELVLVVELARPRFEAR